MAKAKTKDLSNLKGVKVQTPKFILSFPKLYKPEAYQGKGDKWYSITMLFDKKTDLKVLKQAILQAKIEAWGKDKSKWPDDIQSPLKDGNKKTDIQGYEGRIYASAKTKNKPLVVDRAKEKIDEESGEIYPGAICCASVVVKATTNGKENFVSFYLGGVMKLKDGEQLGGGASVDDFEDVDDDDLDDDDFDEDLDSDDDEVGDDDED